MNTGTDEPNPTLQRIGRWLGIGATSVSHAERLLSGLGGLLGILSIFAVSASYAGQPGAVLLVASMGASAVLVFAVPHGALSQPWPVVGGHAVSAVIGVTCYQWVPEPALAAPLAVALAITAMHYLRCIHPPGGATALVAVIGSGELHQLGYEFVLVPVLLNAIVLVGIAILFNLPFRWRRYPAALMRRFAPTSIASDESQSGKVVGQDDLAYALRTLDTFVDVTSGELKRIVALATEHAAHGHLRPADIVLDSYYSNGAYGENWAVRHVVDEQAHADPNHDLVIYRIVAGRGRRSSGVCTRSEFARWARTRVYRDENSWRQLPG